MPLETLQDLLDEITRLGTREAVRFTNGYRTWTLTYRQLARRIGAFGAFLNQRGLGPGDRAVLWSENRPEWLIAFWGCVSRGVEVVPLDPHWSANLASRILDHSRAKLLIVGERTAGHGLAAPTITTRQIAALPEAEIRCVPIEPDNVVEIVFTSGTTGDPRGVVHRHRNICSNLDPIGREIARYRGMARPFQPIRILSLLPLSHMFGQSLALYVPVLLHGAVVFTTESNPEAIIDTVRRNRVSVLGLVPHMLASLRDHLNRRFGLENVPSLGRGWSGAARRWWRYRKIHQLFGFKFWSVVVGGAPVAPELESYWSRLGFAVVQGYGLTESSPVVTVNHPFRARHGSIGKAVPGQVVKLAPDGEILVRGESVAGEYLGAQSQLSPVSEDGWLHTGDIAEQDAEGNIYYKGRKKEVIVTPAGLNVYPQDVEDVLNRLEGVRDSVVVAKREGGREVVHAVLILSDGQEDPSRIVSLANQSLEAHQRIGGWTVWTGEDFPRTASTRKIKRGEVAARLAGEAVIADTGSSGLGAILKSLTGRHGSDLKKEARLNEDLGLSSLDRVALLSQIEDHYGVALDEGRFASLQTVHELEQELAQKEAEGAGEAAPRDPADGMPDWARSLPVRWFRSLAQWAAILPLFRYYIPVTLNGLDHLECRNPPLLFAANHCSHFDTVAILAALPPKWRRLLAPAMQKERFRPFFERNHPWKERLRWAVLYFLACGLFNAFPLPQRMGGVRGSLTYAGTLSDEGYCPLIYPEGARSADGELLPFQPGVGLMALKLNLAVVPVRIRGTEKILSKYDSWPKRGPVQVSFGAPLEAGDLTEPEQIARRVEEAIRKL